MRFTIFESILELNTNNSVKAGGKRIVIVNYFKKYPYALVIIVVLIVWAIINGIESDNYTKKLAKEGMFTIATIKDVKGGHGRWIVVEFEYNGQRYETEKRNETIPHSWIGEKIFIKFLPSKPVVTDFFERIEIPDSLKKISSRVWKELPVNSSVLRSIPNQ